MPREASRKWRTGFANQLFVPAFHQIARLPAIGWIFWLCVDISWLGGKPELIPHKGLFNNNQKLEKSRKEHNDPTQSEENGPFRPPVPTLPARAPSGAWGFLIFIAKIEHEYVFPDYHHQVHRQKQPQMHITLMQPNACIGTENQVIFESL